MQEMPPPPEMREVHFSYVAMRCLPFINVPLMGAGLANIMFFSSKRQVFFDPKARFMTFLFQF